jgi:hypothetical protein
MLYAIIINLIVLNVIIPNVIMLKCHYDVCQNAEYQSHNAECVYTECHCSDRYYTGFHNAE